MSNYCDLTDFWERRRHYVATQYRESPNLLAFLEIYTKQVQQVGEALCGIEFDIDTSTGASLTIIGKVLGWPREHCSGVRKKTFGFCPDHCTARTYNTGGFCDDWVCDGNPFNMTEGQYTFTDDELYRRFLKAMVIRNDNDFRRPSINEALKLLFGDDAGIMRESSAHVDVFTGRLLTDEEYEVAHLYQSVLPVAPGITVSLYETQNGAPFGFGTGWGEFCTSTFPTLLHTTELGN